MSDEKMQPDAELRAAYDAWLASQDPEDLQAELDEMERTDPAVAVAAASYDRMAEQITGRSRSPRSSSSAVTE